ncbi:MAG: helix-turn-helix domain-containing protein [Acidimicrobiales bacterium]
MSGQATPARSGDLARRIAHRREELGLSREELARRAAMDVGYLDYLEHNPAAAPSSGRWFRLARALETTPASLAGGDVGRPPGPGRAGPQPMLGTLTRAQCEDYLAAGGIGRVVFSTDRRPVALPVNFRFVDRQVVFRTRPTASPAITAGAIVSFEVDRIDEAMSEGWSVLVSGRARRVEDRAKLDELALIGLEPWAGGTRETVIRIEIDEISGRAIRQHPGVDLHERCSPRPPLAPRPPPSTVGWTTTRPPVPSHPWEEKP